MTPVLYPSDQSTWQVVLHGDATEILLYQGDAPKVQPKALPCKCSVVYLEVHRGVHFGTLYWPELQGGVPTWYTCRYTLGIQEGVPIMECIKLVKDF